MVFIVQRCFSCHAKLLFGWPQAGHHHPLQKVFWPTNTCNVLKRKEKKMLSLKQHSNAMILLLSGNCSYGQLLLQHTEQSFMCNNTVTLRSTIENLPLFSFAGAAFFAPTSQYQTITTHWQEPSYEAISSSFVPGTNKMENTVYDIHGRIRFCTPQNCSIYLSFLIYYWILLFFPPQLKCPKSFNSPFSILPVCLAYVSVCEVCLFL